MLNQYIKETGMTTKEWAEILDIPYRKLKMIRIGAEQYRSYLTSKIKYGNKNFISRME